VTLSTAQKLTVKLTNAELFNQLRDLHGHSVRTLTDAIDNELAATARKSNGGRAVKRHDRTTVTKSTIGHLSSGKRNTCNPDVAKAISKLFGLPVTALFTSHIDTVTRPVHHNR
jgi:hypothetical protein